MESKFLKPDVNWKEFLKHPMEVMKLDIALKVKQMELSTLMNRGKQNMVSGWCYPVEQEVLDHQKILYSMRCFLQIMSKEYFRFYFSDSHVDEVRSSFNEARDDNSCNFQSCRDAAKYNITTMHDNQLFMLMMVSGDVDNTKRVYRDMLNKILQQLNLPCNRNLLEKIVNNVEFRIDRV